ncbi:phosphate acetyltransferase [Candidatus Omnitrophota bacterium]
MDTIINHLRERARQQIKTIVLPEGSDERIQRAAQIVEAEKIAKTIVLDTKTLDPEKIQKFSEEYCMLRKKRGISMEDAQKKVSNPLYYAAMMTRMDFADGFVAGAVHTTADVAKAGFRCIGLDSRYKTFSSSFIMAIPNCEYGESGVLVFSDCAIVPNPNAQALAQIAVACAELTHQVLGIVPRVAMLSYSTKGSAKGSEIDKVAEATQIAKTINPDLIIDGELQVDTAIIPDVAQKKNPDGIIKGDANVLIFPDLEAGNIGYKMVDRFAKARSIGPLLQGLNKPCADLSRGCSVDEIVDTVAITALRTHKHNEEK